MDRRNDLVFDQYTMIGGGKHEFAISTKDAVLNMPEVEFEIYGDTEVTVYFHIEVEGKDPLRVPFETKRTHIYEKWRVKGLTKIEVVVPKGGTATVCCSFQDVREDTLDYTPVEIILPKRPDQDLIKMVNLAVSSALAQRGIKEPLDLDAEGSDFDVADDDDDDFGPGAMEFDEPKGRDDRVDRDDRRGDDRGDRSGELQRGREPAAADNRAGENQQQPPASAPKA